MTKEELFTMACAKIASGMVGSDDYAEADAEDIAGDAVIYSLALFKEIEINESVKKLFVSHGDIPS